MVEFDIVILQRWLIGTRKPSAGLVRNRYWLEYAEREKKIDGSGKNRCGA